MSTLEGNPGSQGDLRAATDTRRAHTEEQNRAPEQVGALGHHLPLRTNQSPQPLKGPIVHTHHEGPAQKHVVTTAQEEGRPQHRPTAVTGNGL